MDMFDAITDIRDAAARAAIDEATRIMAEQCRCSYTDALSIAEALWNDNHDIDDFAEAIVAAISENSRVKNSR